jgi:sulfite reductase alpha subunit-like flavoprotein
MVKALSNRVKCTILYATETGKSERFAKTLCEIFKHTFDAKVCNTLSSLIQREKIIVIVQTFIL